MRSTGQAWLRATLLGWILGVPMIALMAVIGESFGIGGLQGLVGLGMGTSVGVSQSRQIRTELGQWFPWVLASAIGLSVPFLVADFAAYREWPLTYSLPVCVATGGLIVGCWQAYLLHARVTGAGRWILASGVGWALAAAAVMLADAVTKQGMVRGPMGAVVYLGLISVGGLVLGAVTGFARTRLAPR